MPLGWDERVFVPTEIETKERAFKPQSCGICKRELYRGTHELANNGGVTTEPGGDPINSSRLRVEKDSSVVFAGSETCRLTGRSPQKVMTAATNLVPTGAPSHENGRFSKLAAFSGRQAKKTSRKRPPEASKASDAKTKISLTELS